MPGYFYAASSDSIYVNLFASSDATVTVGGGRVSVSQRTDAPWGGKVVLTVSPRAPAEFALRVRVPGWAFGRPIPSALYAYADARGKRLKVHDEDAARIPFHVNGRPIKSTLENGYAVIRRTWKPGDRVDVEFPDSPRRVLGNISLDAALYRVAVEKGPIVFCAEGVDNGGSVLRRVLHDGDSLVMTPHPDLLGGLETIAARSGEGTTTLVPYYAWSNRGPGEMVVWFLRR